MCLGVPMKITELLPNSQAKALAGSVSLTVSTELLEEVNLGDYVIVHAGYAINTLDEKAAHETMELLRELAATHEAMEQEQLAKE